MTDPRPTSPDEERPTPGGAHSPQEEGDADHESRGRFAGLVERFAHQHGDEWVAMDFDERAYTCAQCGISLRI